MSDNYITGSHPLRLEALEERNKLALKGGHERLLAKIDALLALNSLHGGQQITLERLIAQARAL